MLQLHQAIALKCGSAIFYHECQTDSDKKLHFLIHVPGENIASYFKYLASTPFDLGSLENFGQVFDRGFGYLDDSLIRQKITAHLNKQEH